MKSRKILLLLDDTPTLVTPEKQKTLALSGLNLSQAEVITAHLSFDEIENSQRLADLAKSQDVSVVICFRLSVIRHFAKEFIDVCDLIVKLQDVGVSFQSVEEQIDTESDKFYLKKLMSGWVKSKEALKKENPKISQLKAKMKGHKLGRPQKRDDQQIQELRKLGFSIRDIAAKTGVSTAAVQRALTHYDVNS